MCSPNQPSADSCVSIYWAACLSQPRAANTSFPLDRCPPLKNRLDPESPQLSPFSPKSKETPLQATAKMISWGDGFEEPLNWSMATFPPMNMCRWKMLSQPCSQANGKGTATQLVASLPSQSRGWTEALLAKNKAFKALPGTTNMPLDFREKQSIFLTFCFHGLYRAPHWMAPQGSLQPYLPTSEPRLSWIQRSKCFASHLFRLDTFSIVQAAILTVRTLNKYLYKHRHLKFKIVWFPTWLGPCFTPWRKWTVSSELVHSQ